MQETTTSEAHYVCTGGCGGTVAGAKMCDAEECNKRGQPLTICYCTDGRHFAAFESDGEELSE